MNRTQKGAWCGLVLTLFLLLIPVIDLIEKDLGLLLTHVVGYSVGLPLLILMIYIIRKIEKQPGVKFDERDKSIVIKAVIVSFTTLSAILLGGYVVTFLGLGEMKSFSVSNLPVIVYVSSIIFVFVCLFRFWFSMARTAFRVIRS